MITLRRRPARSAASRSSATGHAVLQMADRSSRTARWRGYLLANIAGTGGPAPAHVLEIDAASALITSPRAIAPGELVEVRLPVGAEYARRNGIPTGEMRLRGIVSPPRRDGWVDIYEVVFASTPIEFDADDYASVHGMRRPVAVPALAG